jgi:hypothetical protein
MKGLLRRLRGIIGTGLTWCVAWGGLFTVAGLVGVGDFVAGLAMTGAFLGLVGGSAFAVILSIAERRHSLADLSLWRVALWGAVGGALMALLFGGGNLFLDFVAFMAFSGAVSSAGTVAVAKRADARLIEGGDESALGLEVDEVQRPVLRGELE